MLKSAQRRGGSTRCEKGDDNLAESNGSSNSSRSSTTTVVGGRNFWVRVALLLLKNGAKWDENTRVDGGKTQLMLLFTGPSPPIGDANLHREIVRHCFKQGKNIDVNAVDDKGRTALLYFCLRESKMPKSTCISSLGILEDFMENGGDVNILDREGLGPMNITGEFKGNGYELLQSKLYTQLGRESVGYARPIRSVVEELSLAKADLFMGKPAKKSTEKSPRKKERQQKQNMTVHADEIVGNHFSKEKKRTKHTTSVKIHGDNLLSPPSRRVSSQELNELWTQSAKKNGGYSSRHNTMR